MQLPTQRLLRELPMVAKLDQRRDVARSDAERLQCLGEAVHCDPAQLDDQERGPLLGDPRRRALCRGFWHTPNVSTHQSLVYTNPLLRSCDLATCRQPEPPDHPRRSLPRRHLLRALAVVGRPRPAADPELPPY